MRVSLRSLFFATFRSRMFRFAATVSVLDDSVGQVFEALKKRGATENSVIMFMSDNGGAGAEQGLHFNPPSTFANNWPLRGAKASQ